jgi:hypothetical protein
MTKIVRSGQWPVCLNAAQSSVSRGPAVSVAAAAVKASE